jgi:Ferritin-like domain
MIQIGKPLYPTPEFAHVLEQLETAFYTQALSKFQASDFTNAGFVTAAIAVEQFTQVAMSKYLFRLTVIYRLSQDHCWGRIDSHGLTRGTSVYPVQ